MIAGDSARCCSRSAFALPAPADPPRDSLHPGNGEVEAGPDLRGLSFLIPTRRRTPSGILYPWPPELQDLTELARRLVGAGEPRGRLLLRRR